MDFYFQILLSAIVIGAFYGIVGLGITFVLRVTRVLNLAHSAVAMVCGLAYAVGVAAGYPSLIVALHALALGALLGWGLGIFLQLTLTETQGIVAVFVTLAVGMLLEGLCVVIFGKDPLGAPPIINLPALHVGGAVITGAQGVMILLTLLCTMLFACWFFYSNTGKIYRAMVDDGFGAMVMGVPIAQLQAIAFAIGGLLAAVAGISITPIMSMSHSTANIMLVNGLTASILGGVSNPFGALAGGLLVGLIQTTVAGTISSLLILPASMVLLLIAMIVRPEGLLPTGQRERTI